MSAIYHPEVHQAMRLMTLTRQTTKDSSGAFDLDADREPQQILHPTAVSVNDTDTLPPLSYILYDSTPSLPLRWLLLTGLTLHSILSYSSLPSRWLKLTSPLSLSLSLHLAT